MISSSQGANQKGEDGPGTLWAPRLLSAEECRQSRDKKEPLKRPLRKDKKNAGKKFLRVRQGRGSFKSMPVCDQESLNNL